MIHQITIYLIIFWLVVLALMVYVRPGIATTLVWSMITLESVLQQGNDFLLNNSTLINYLIAGIAAMAAFWALISGKYRKVTIPVQLWLYLSLIGLASLSYMWSISPDDTFAQLQKNLPYIIAFGFLAPMCVFDEKQLSSAITVLIYFGALVVLGVNFSESGRRGIILMVVKGNEISGNPLAAASFSGYVAFAALFSIFGEKLTSPKSLVKIAIVVACVAAMIQSGSRGQLLAFGGVAMIFFPILSRAAAKRSVILTILAAILIMGAGIIMVDQLGWSKRWDYQQLVDDQFARIDMLTFMLNQNYKAGPFYWLLGVGSSASFKFFGGYPHNTLGETLAEEGLIGFLLLCAMLVISFRQGYSMVKSHALSRRTRVNVSIIVAIFTFDLILSMKEGSLLTSSTSLLSVAMTIAWLSSKLAKTNPSVEVRRAPAPVRFPQNTAQPQRLN